MQADLADKPFATLRAAQGEEDQNSMARTELCSRRDCAKQVVTSLGTEKLCFDHFFARCYELLEHANANIIAAPRHGPALLEELYPLDECSRRALEISLLQTELTNLERARILDILLWSGDLVCAMRRARRPQMETAKEGTRPGLQPVALREKTAPN